MRYFKKIILVVIMSAFICLPVRAEMTLKELFFDESKPFHLKILDVIPEEGIVQIGDENAKNTIIEFMDYFCGYCKKVHPELLQIANEREDTRIVFLQHPILSESSKLLANMVVAANMQNKGIDHILGNHHRALSKCHFPRHQLIGQLLREMQLLD